MNRIYRLVWSRVSNGWVAVAENTPARGKRARSRLIAAALLLAAGAAQAAPIGGQVASGAGSVSQSGSTTTIRQSSPNLSLDWKSFNISPTETVNFVQPSASSVVLNRISDPNGTQILGNINANGHVYLINPGGILFGHTAQVNVGALVASTMNLNEAGMNGNTRSFSGGGAGSVVNQGTINAAKGGYVALLGNHVSNQGVITAQLGTVALGAGTAATLAFNGNSLISLRVDQSLFNSLAENGGLIRADGGLVVMNAGAENALVSSVVNTTGVIRAQRVENRNGTIMLLAGMTAGTTNVGGTLDASAPNGGDGGFIETSAARVNVADDAKITTAAASGHTGTWLIDPYNVTISNAAGNTGGSFTANTDDSIINAATLQSALGSTNVTVTTGAGGTQAGNITVASPLTWSAATTLGLTAAGAIAINAPISITGAGGVNLNATAQAGITTTGLTFGNGAAITYGGGGIAGQSFALNGISYQLVHSMAQLDAIDSINGVTGGALAVYGAGLAGNYAIATDLTATGTTYARALIGTNTPTGRYSGRFDGLGHTITGLTINSVASAVGLIGASHTGSSVSNVGLVGGSVTGVQFVGALVGLVNTADGVVQTSYASTTVTGSISTGGLVGKNTGTVQASYASGTVTGGDKTGGLVGLNNPGTITNSYATGTVTGTTVTGGLTGQNSGIGATVQSSYATGAVIGLGAGVGGLIASMTNGVALSSYWDTQTSGQATSVGGTGLTTAQLQGTTTVALSAAFSGGAAGGTSGLYPYLTRAFPTGMQPVSGIAYKDAGVTPAGSGASGVVPIALTLGGVTQRSVNTGANGYYYFGLPAGSISSSGTIVLATTAANGSTGAQNGAAIVIATGTTPGLDIYGGSLLATTAATTYSDFAGTGPTGLLGTVASYATTPAFVSSLPSVLTATGAGFTFDQALTLSSGMALRTTAASAPITVAAPITLAGANTLTLNSAGALAINETVNVTGAGSVVLTAAAQTGVTTTGLTFGSGASVNYGATDHAGSFSLNGGSYKLVYSMGNLDAIDSINALDGNALTQYGAGLAGKYALATNLDATGTTYTKALIGTNSSATSATQFTGQLDGLGHTVTGVTITAGVADNIGLIGYQSGAGSSVSNIGLVGGTVSGHDNVGALVGNIQGGTIQTSFATAAVSGNQRIGGLIGSTWISPLVQSSYAGGAVTGVNSTGGLIGTTDFGTMLQSSYATGAVRGGDSTGGLVGIVALTTLRSSYATGAVAGTTNTGGLIGKFLADPNASVATSYWDTQTSGQSTSAGGAGATGLTTAQLQGGTTVSLGAAFSGGAAGGTAGLYPYLVNAFPDGVQAVSGIAYKDAGVTLAASGASGAVPIGLTLDGVTQSSVSTGANGYYYFGLPAGSISNSGTILLATTAANAPTGVLNGAAIVNAIGTTTGLDIYGGSLPPVTTAATTYSAMGNVAPTTLLAAVAGYATTPAFVTSLPLLINSTGASFTLDQALDLTSSLAVRTTAANAPITVAAPITVRGANTLSLTAAGALALDGSITLADTTSATLSAGTTLAVNAPITMADTTSATLSAGTTVAINAPITMAGISTLTLNSAGALAINETVNVTGGGSVVLTAAAQTGITTTGLIFGSGASLNYGATDHGGSFSLNGIGYKLVYSMSNLDAIDSVNAVNGNALTLYGAGLAGKYALATDLDATGTTYTKALIGTNSSGNSSTRFTGWLDGLGNTITGLTISAGAADYIGLIGYQTGVNSSVSNMSIVGGSVSGHDNVGGLVGTVENGMVQTSHATGTVTGNNNVGGLAGSEFFSAKVQSSYATGAVTGVLRAGGLIGAVDFASSLKSSYATGAVRGSDSIGGLAGSVSLSTVQSSYATGAVTGATNTGGLIGKFTTSPSASVATSFWDIQTTGQSISAGGSGATGLTTAQLQGTPTVSLGAAFSGGAAGGTAGLYPYLVNAFPNGVRAVSGIAYKDAGVTLAASGASGAVPIGLTLDGVTQSSVTAGANGYYYFASPAGSISNSGTIVLATTAANAPTGVLNGAAIVNATGTTTGLDIYGGSLPPVTTAATTYSALGNLAPTTLLAAVAGYATTPAFVTSLPILINSTGASFTLDQTLDLTSSLAVRTTAANAPITVAAPITVRGANTLSLTAAGALAVDGSITLADTTSATLSAGTTLAVNAPITLAGANTLTLNSGGLLGINGTVNVAGAGSVVLTAGPQTGLTTTGLTFGIGGSVNYGATDHGGSFSLNGIGYKLVYSMSNLDAIDGVNAVNGNALTQYGTGLTANYALATNLDATGTTYTKALIGTNSSATSATRFTGWLDGLGNTVTGLTISAGAADNIGLIGYQSGVNSSVSNMGLVGGSVSGHDNVGGLVGTVENGMVQTSHTTGTVTGNNNVGGLAGSEFFSARAQSSFATGAVTGVLRAGGLIGAVDFGSTLQSSYATGAVTGTSQIGGLAGSVSLSTVQTSYATGAVTGNTNKGGLIGTFTASASASVATSYWDIQTTGQSTSAGGAGATGLTTAQLQGTTTVSLGAAFSGGAAGGTAGLYPYLVNAFPNGVRAVSGIAYKDAGVTFAASSASGAVPIALTLDGVTQSSVTTGANGYYYFALPAGSISNSGTIALATTAANAPTGVLNGAAIVSATGTTTGLDIYGGSLPPVTTAATTYSAMGNLAPTTLLTAVAGYATTPAFVTSLPILISSTGASFTLDQALDLTSGLSVRTTAANAPITVAAPITVRGTNTLSLTAAGALSVNAPITLADTTLATLSAGTTLAVNAPITLAGANTLTLNSGGLLGINGTVNVAGTGSVVLTAGPQTGLTTTGLTFGIGASVNYGATDNGGSFTLNGTGYKLVYSMSNLDAIDGINALDGSALTQYGAGLTGKYALATHLNATGTTYTKSLIGTNSSATAATRFTGWLDGLGNTVTGLTISAGAADYVGLIGYQSGVNSVVSNMSIVGGSVSGHDNVGGLMGSVENGMVQTSHTTGAATGNNNTGGLAGSAFFAAKVQSSYATGAMTGVLRVGGLIGALDFGSSLQSSYATGPVTGTRQVGGLIGVASLSTVRTSYATGAVTGSLLKGGLLGEFLASATASVATSFWDIQTTGMATSAGGAGAIGLTTAQMRTQANFTSATSANGNADPAWDFANTWVMYDTFTSPLLRSFMTPLTVTANSNSKTYDGLAYSGVNGVSYSITPNGNLLGTVSYTDASQGAVNAGSYVVTPSGLYSNQQGYILSYASGALTVNRAVLTATVAAPDKAYDGNTTAAPTLTIIGGLVGSETLIATGTASFNTKDVATANLVTVNTASLANGSNGGLASNYTLAAGETVAAHITAKALTATVAAPGKVYDGDTTAAPTLTITAGLVGSETVTATGTASFNTKDVATASLVTVNTTSLLDGSNGGLASNYSLATGESVAATITAKTLMATVAATSKAYDGDTTATPSLTITAGLVGSETVNATGTATFNTKDVLTANLLTVNSTALGDGANGGIASNYSLAAGQTVAANITPKALTATVAAPNKVYDGDTTAAPTLSITAGLVGTETVTATGTASFNTKDVATANVVTVDTTSLLNGSNGGLASNYSLAAGETVAANITTKALTATVATPNKVYDGDTTAAPTLSITAGLVGTETVTATGTASFNTKDVATANLVTVDTTALADGTNGGLASNYSLATGETVAANITPKALTATVAAPSKTYDGDTTGTPTLSIAAGLVGAETVSATGTGRFNTKDVLTANLVTVDSTALADGSNGGLASNYSLASGQSVAANITPRALAVSGTTAENKVYDGGTSATVNTGAASLNGLVAGDVVQVGATGAFTDKNVDTGKTVILTSTYTGADVGNYSIIGQASATADISAKALSVSGTTADSKVYDGGTAATVNTAAASFNGLVAGDFVNLSASGVFADSNVAIGKTVTLTSTYDGADARNYNITSQRSATADITAAPPTLTGITPAPPALTDITPAPPALIDITAAPPTLTLSTPIPFVNTPQFALNPTPQLQPGMISLPIALIALPAGLTVINGGVKQPASGECASTGASNRGC